MYENKDNNIVVVASTGSGKTEGAFLWADDSKVFYTLPLQVSINAIYDRIVDKKKAHMVILQRKHQYYILMRCHIC